MTLSTESDSRLPFDRALLDDEDRMMIVLEEVIEGEVMKEDDEEGDE